MPVTIRTFFGWRRVYFVTKQQPPSPITLKSLQSLAIIAIVVAVGQVTLGGVVRATGSGLGCPDWPLCYGSIIPPLNSAALIEYSHRFSGSILGILVFALAIVSFLRYRFDRWLVIPATSAAVLVLVAGGLGGLTVVTELEWWLRLLHLGVAEMIICCLAVVFVASRYKMGNNLKMSISINCSSALLTMSMLSLFGLILYGSYMVGQGYGTSCGTWPLCDGSILPFREPYLVHMLHRIMAVLVGIIISIVAISVIYREEQWSIKKWLAAVLISLFIIQGVVGAITVWSGFTPLMKSVHLSLATMVWLSLSLLSALQWVSRSDDSHKMTLNTKDE